MTGRPPPQCLGYTRRILALVLPMLGCHEVASKPAEGDDTSAPSLAAQLWAELDDPSEFILPAMPTDGDFSAFPQDPKNPITTEKVVLGRELFFEPGLAAIPWHEGGYHRFSCASCHDPLASFGSGTAVGRGFGEGGTGDLANRVVQDIYLEDPADLDICRLNEMRVMNVAWRGPRGGWEGMLDGVDPSLPGVSPNHLIETGYSGMEGFVYGVLDQHRMWGQDEPTPHGSVVYQNGSAAALAYAPLYAAAFPDIPEADRYTKTNTALAIGAFVRTITASEAPFQQFLRLPPGTETDLPMSDEALAGAVLFFGEGRCVQCHSGPALSGEGYAVLGNRYTNDTDLLPIETPPEGDTGNPGTAWVGKTVADYMNAVLLYPDKANLGRALVTETASDIGAFAIVSVYGAGDPNQHRWGHGGWHDSLESFLKFKVGEHDDAEVDPMLVENRSPVLSHSGGDTLTDEQIHQIAVFVEEGLQDTTLDARYGRHVSLAGLPTPNND